jgi:trans-aconitate methyltransferase
LIGNRALLDVNWSDDKSLDYHINQWKTPKVSTLDFIGRIKHLVKPYSRVLDIGCGGGAATNTISQSYPLVNWLGVDNDAHLINLAKEYSLNSRLSNLDFAVGDIFGLADEEYDGVISLQTISWLPDFKEPIKNIALRSRPKWIAITGLFYPGEITAQTTIHEHLRSRSVNYNTYSLPRFSHYCESLGYKTTYAEPFEFPFDLSPPSDLNYMGTYTYLSMQGKRIQVSGPILMNWMTIILEK